MYIQDKLKIPIPDNIHLDYEKARKCIITIALQFIGFNCIIFLEYNFTADLYTSLSLQERK